MIPIVCISDLHMGEPYALLRDPDVGAYVAGCISRLAGGRIGRLVLLGDTHEQAIPESADAPFKIAARFFERLLCDPHFGCAVDEVIWLPGNHDHSLWTGYVRGARGSENGVALGTGDVLWEHGDAPNAAARELVLKGIGAAALARIGRIRVFNPFYVQSVGSNVIVFHHGHYFDDLLTGQSPTKARLMGVSPAIVEAAQAALASTTVAQVEARLAPLLDAIYGFEGAGNTRRSVSWELLIRTFRAFGTNEDCVAARAGAAPALGRVSESQPLPEELRRNAALVLGRFILPTVPAESAVKLVFGHTHDGGEFDLTVGARAVRCYNTGGWVSWVTENGRIVPHTHVLTVAADGTVNQSAIQFQPSDITASARHGRSAHAVDPGPAGGLAAAPPSLNRQNVFD